MVMDLREALQRIQNFTFSTRSEYQTLMNNVEDCLIVMCKAGVSQINFTPEDKLELGILVQNALPAISSRINYIVSDFPPRDIQSSKYERSGLQFLFDDYKDFPVCRAEGDASELSQVLSDFKAKEDVDEWDGYLRRFFVDHFDPSTGTPQSSPNVPLSHWWFFEN